ncbi:PREDICTED: uncharacterized protein LOC109155735 isoform X2 [Ipomoea nil]|uniref:uncharacterized protein LOC109155735 isoform X2 n=1 Tax=Ipomoea nil TaxID=35883 RepID=UPI000901E511|nr:PREDICTED: uncharacterized protein LOC109155735 isoform X2 [Ipomoea nil]
MVRFSCFHAQIHSHKQKPVQMSAEVMQKSLEDHSQNHSMKDFSYCQATSPPHLNEECDAGHVIDSSSNDHGSKSEENGDEYKSECTASVDHNSANIKKSKSLGFGLGWEEGRLYDDYNSEDESRERFSFDGSDTQDGAKDFVTNLLNNSQEVQPSTSVQVNSDLANSESISVIEYQKESEREEECENYGFHQSGADEPVVHPPRTSFTFAKSCSLPNMHSTGQHFTSSMPYPRSAEDLIVLETRRKEIIMDGLAKQVMQHGEREGYVQNDEKITGENPVDDNYGTYNYVGSAKEWIVPVLDEVSMQKNINGESLVCQLNELPNKDFRQKRIEEWVTNLQDCDPLEETNELAIPDSSDHEKIHNDKVLDGSPLGKLDEKVNPGMEAVKKYISSLSALATSVQLVNHGLVVIPFLSTFLSLKALNLSGNSIAKITAGALPRGLHILNLSRNNISTIEGLRELTRLRVLDLSYNRILRIGHGLAYCSSLKELYLAGNKISEVEGLHRLLKLNILDLRFNKISTAKSLGQLAANYNSLQAINLEGNPAQKNVGHEQLRKYVQSLLPQLAYYNRQSIKIGTLKDSSDRSSRLGIGSHQADRGVKAELKVVRKGTTSVSSHKASSSSIHGRKGQSNSSPKRSKSRHGHLPPSASRRSNHHLHPSESNNKLANFRPEPSMRRSRSEGTLGIF